MEIPAPPVKLDPGPVAGQFQLSHPAAFPASILFRPGRSGADQGRANRAKRKNGGR